MAVSLKGRDFLTIHDWTREELTQVLDTADLLKLRQKAGLRDRPLEGRSVGLIFTKPSTRTRVSFEVGVYQLGAQPIYLSGADMQLRRGETLADTARTLSRYLDGIMIRTFAHADVEELARYADIPVINGLTDWQHPCQVMGDLMTIREKRGRLDGIHLAYVGAGNNMAHSLLEGGAKFGMRVTVAYPPEYPPDPVVVERAKADAARSGGSVELFPGDPEAAVAGADVVYTDVWASMGEEAQAEERARRMQAFRVTPALMARAKPDALFMHCLPAHRGEEVVDEVIDGPWSVVWDEAENRLHVQKAIMALVIA
ncbi:ornithine carbamoyltransferase [Caldinitratiruptor microaerophilus]|uniref:Ornithine carbamoyltransferase n=1 Tax=Caldinitratiruptor microaerophilus TaxID=671077 RepID=A0AA35CP04_9FIRM|nr:ornithine carbamoyltransferase [Caldinitratiruptor microaerophilus]BDG61197.1 ornithine carbamoyltransferase [Caldinitratiruptor microaerophilus]